MTKSSLNTDLNLELETALSLDREDPTSHLADKFELPDDIIYLCGNSLGAMPKSVPKKMKDALNPGWSNGLITSWNNLGWHRLPLTLGDRLAPLMGANPGEVVVADSVSINIFKALVASLKMRPDRTNVVSEASNFPTDVHVIKGALQNFFPDVKLRLGEETDDDMLELIDEKTAVVCLTHVNYKTGRIRDMKRITEAAHAVGALVIWDLCHTFGAVPVDLNEHNVDFAVGCTYKYFNSGHGSPAFIFVAERNIEVAPNSLSGWHGQMKPFDFDISFAENDTIEKFRCGSPPLLAHLPILESLEIYESVKFSELRKKSQGLTQYFIELVEAKCAGMGLKLISPRDPEQRGSQVSFTHEHGYPVMSALIDHKVIGDFRAPNIIRFGFSALYNSYEDVWKAAEM
ncbi:MAG: kynureninase, partial [Emcibacteraceae bacterium]|nr:kynureninase [Emcibacteraceae bacterium]